MVLLVPVVRVGLVVLVVLLVWFVVPAGPVVADGGDDTPYGMVGTGHKQAGSS